MQGFEADFDSVKNLVRSFSLRRCLLASIRRGKKFARRAKIQHLLFVEFFLLSVRCCCFGLAFLTSSKIWFAHLPQSRSQFISVRRWQMPRVARIQPWICSLSKLGSTKTPTRCLFLLSVRCNGFEQILPVAKIQHIPCSIFFLLLGIYQQFKSALFYFWKSLKSSIFARDIIHS